MLVCMPCTSYQYLNRETFDNNSLDQKATGNSAKVFAPFPDTSAIPISLPFPSRNERDSHARILLRMLRSGKIGAPFSSDPPTGSLTSLHEVNIILIVFFYS